MMPRSKDKKAKAQPPQIVSMSATGGTLLLPDAQDDQDVEIQYGYRFKGKWKLAQVVHRLPGSPVCVTVGGLKTSKTYIFRTRHQIHSNPSQPWADWSAASDTGQTSPDLGAVVSAQVLSTRLAAHYRGVASSDGPIPATLVPSLSQSPPAPPQALPAATAAALREDSSRSSRSASAAMPASDGLRLRRQAPPLSASALLSTTSTPQEAEPPASTPIPEAVPASRSTWYERRTHEVARQEQVTLEQELWQTAWDRNYCRSKHDAEEVRKFVPLALLLMCTVNVAEVQIWSMTGFVYFIIVGRELMGGLRELAIRSWSLALSAALLLVAFLNWLIAGSRTGDLEPEETRMGGSWISWAWSTLRESLYWVIAAFQWYPNDLEYTRTAEHRIIVDQDDERGAATTDQVLGPSENQVASWLWVDHPLVIWRQLWVDNPAGSFLYDHWVATMLASWVIGISCCSLLYSLLQSNFGIAKLVRRIVWVARYWLKAVVLGSFAFRMMQSGTQEYWLQSAYVSGYLVLWLSSVLWVATVDSISDALGRPSTFTADRVAILFASMFVVGLPVLFWVAAHGIGWRIVSPLAFGLGVDGFGRAFLSEPLRDLAYLPVRLLLSVVELPILRVLRDLMKQLVQSRLLAQVLNYVVTSRELCVSVAGSLYILPKGLERFAQCQTWTDPGCTVGMVHTFVGICGMLAAIELLSTDNNGRPRHPVLCTALTPFLTALRVVLTVALPRSAHWAHATVSRCYRAMSAYWHVVSDFFFAVWSVMCRAASAAWNLVRRIASFVWPVVCSVASDVRRFASAVWGQWRRITRAVWTIASSVWSVVCSTASAVWGQGCRITRVIATFVWPVVCSVASGVRRVASAVWGQWRRIARAVRTIASSVWSVVCSTASAVWGQGCRITRVVWTLMCSFGNRAYQIVRVLWRPVWTLMCHVGAVLRTHLARLGRAIWRRCQHLFTVVYRFIQHFTRAYWRLLPTGLAVQTCIRFGLALLRSPAPEASAALGFLLATVAVGIIAAILVRDLFMRTFAWSSASNRQYVATDRASAYYEEQSLVDNMLLYVDLGAVAAARWTITNIGDIFRLLIEHGSRWLAQALHSAIRKMVQMSRLIYSWVLLPVLKKIKTIVLVIWGSPVLCSAAALGSLWLLWAHHSGTWRWHRLDRMLVVATIGGAELLEATIEHVLYYGEAMAATGYEWTSRVVVVLVVVLDNTTKQMVAAAEAGDIESPRLAWVVWMVIVIATKSQSEIRLKTLMWPFVVLWVTALVGGAQHLPLVMIGVLVWCGAAVRVRTYEQRERIRVRNHWGDLQQQRQQRRQRHAGVLPAPAPLRPTGRAKEPKFKDQTECSICLESLRDQPTRAARSPAAGGTAVQPEEDAIGMLPCGHCFHSDCIGQWLQREARCPLCRQAVHGIDRVLEIVF